MKSLKTVQTISKVLGILTKIGYIFTIIGAAGVLAGGIILLCIPSIGENIVSLALSEIPDVNASRLGVTLISESVCLIGAAVAMYFTCKYFKNELADGTPFTHRGAKELLRAGIINIAVPLGAICIAAIICTIFDVPEPDFSNESGITTGVTMLLLSFVFNYGADLLDSKQPDRNISH